MYFEDSSLHSVVWDFEFSDMNHDDFLEAESSILAVVAEKANVDISAVTLTYNTEMRRNLVNVQKSLYASRNIYFHEGEYYYEYDQTVLPTLNPPSTTSESQDTVNPSSSPTVTIQSEPPSVTLNFKVEFFLHC